MLLGLRVEEAVLSRCSIIVERESNQQREPRFLQREDQSSGKQCYLFGVPVPARSALEKGITIASRPAASCCRRSKDMNLRSTNILLPMMTGSTPSF
jgi:hypothetical protein